MRQTKFDDAQKLYDKPWKRTVDATRNERDLGYGRLSDYRHSAKVEVFWGLDHAGMFIMKIDGKEIMLSADQMIRFLRWV